MAASRHRPQGSDPAPLSGLNGGRHVEAWQVARPHPGPHRHHRQSRPRPRPRPRSRRLCRGLSSGLRPGRGRRRPDPADAGGVPRQRSGVCPRARQDGAITADAVEPARLRGGREKPPGNLRLATGTPQEGMGEERGSRARCSMDRKSVHLISLSEFLRPALCRSRPGSGGVQGIHPVRAPFSALA
ncbi:hypothetical protein PHAMO_420006 [Magnetospirillum molischianum DSM 120]|uniref:Uncharacterized protein n=1 Tax=Magnetospirillum molischianum DSM 120 TaxID=1150626 RepID=H8FWI6_MAGML|nr:hypothetical protein PHAMO_420006 [Magnetospirillum molischianum DSM 120]